MLINKRKQEINSKLRHKEKVTESESNANECAPLSLNEAILLDPISPVGVQASEVECPYEEAGLFDEALELKKEKLPLSKHDLSLWENMNLV
ncbi:MAG: hypothetical protein JST59_01840 [Actinobacteria bacterium]|nr:hypothetical protein [Actinomycetota bacterium]